ncbi:hypothetical protein BGI41_05055 [Methanobrevibacter sp. 87.7]|uniref:hypothetical protein n=1 Tax=Methanobrevibacter sp. 87.7 TaxID=387957 RepID=UPI000B50989A|nr:hypothetical protein [Methanobrevibacter sp. 87.7]OWT32930.1 hypothetical protein BGI41_05055 [Methanobrevibacter sp. 87.7]
MKNTKKSMIKNIKKIYKTLDKVSPADYDCGKLCNEICCVYDKYNTDNEVGLYLLPGEELIYEDDDKDFELYYIPPDETEYNYDLYLVKCVNPPHCKREIRPIQCRTFPLIPHIEDNKFHLIIDENEFPYICPLIHDENKLNKDFIETTYKVWNVLIKNPAVYDLIKLDSQRRIKDKDDYTIVI